MQMKSMEDHRSTTEMSQQTNHPWTLCLQSALYEKNMILWWTTVQNYQKPPTVNIVKFCLTAWQIQAGNGWKQYLVCPPDKWWKGDIVFAQKILRQQPNRPFYCWGGGGDFTACHCHWNRWLHYETNKLWKRRPVFTCKWTPASILKGETMNHN